MTSFSASASVRVAVIGGGPAGLMAAEILAAGGAHVDLFDAMPSVGRKFLLAGKGGLNLTHGEAFDAFVARYGSRRSNLLPMLERFGPKDVREWARNLGVETFVGSSGRVFPADLKAAPLLRAWLHRIRQKGVRFHMRHRWLGWSGDVEGSSPDTHAIRPATHTLRFETPGGEREIECDAVVLALGGASWSRLGSDGAWVRLLANRGIDIAPLRPSNCGFDVACADGTVEAGWTEHFQTRFAGQPMKNVAMSIALPDGTMMSQAGEFVITEGGVEGSLVYALSGPARDAIAEHGTAMVHIDLLPSRPADFVRDEVARPRGSRSLSTHLKSRLGLEGVKAALLHELLPRDVIADPSKLAAAIKSLPLTLLAARPIDEAISSAGGVRFESLDEGSMLSRLPGVFCAGEMLDWEAPTGGYLLTACFASGVSAAAGALEYLQRQAAAVDADQTSVPGNDRR